MVGLAGGENTEEYMCDTDGKYRRTFVIAVCKSVFYNKYRVFILSCGLKYPKSAFAIFQITVAFSDIFVPTTFIFSFDITMHHPKIDYIYTE